MTNAGSLAIDDDKLAPGDTTIPGSFVDLFKSTPTDPDPCETDYAEATDDDGSVTVPYSCTFHDLSRAGCDVTACQPIPGGWNSRHRTLTRQTE